MTEPSANATPSEQQSPRTIEAIARLTGGLAHDFNNLLLVIIGNLDDLREELEGNPSATEKIDATLQASLRGAELTRQMLAFSRQQVLRPKEVALASLIEGTIRLLDRTLGQNIQIEFKNAPDTPAVLIDDAQLHTALLNIALNARDAMPAGGRMIFETSAVELSAPDAEVPPGRYAVVSITDTGIGIAPDVVPRIFEPFFTTKQPGAGSGLGLAMVHGFTMQSGGHIAVHSEVGRGTTFTLYLPRAAGQ